MGIIIDITGYKFNKLTVVEKVAAKSKSSAYWLCKCDCGNESIVAGCKLKSGTTKSCGCYKKEVFNNYKHGFANKTRTYKTWKLMRQRCYNSNSDNWNWYGGRGVKVCKEWLDDYTNFLRDMGERPEGKTIDRINPYGNYEPLNCRWATQKEQMNNTKLHYNKKLKE